MIQARGSRKSCASTGSQAEAESTPFVPPPPGYRRRDRASTRRRFGSACGIDVKSGEPIWRLHRQTPLSFSDWIRGAAQRSGLPANRVLLGGDHLGPFPWRSENADSALEKGSALVRACVLSGYHKIHLDASMPCADDRSASLDDKPWQTELPFCACRRERVWRVAIRFSANRLRDRNRSSRPGRRVTRCTRAGCDDGRAHAPNRRNIPARVFRTKSVVGLGE